MTALSTMDTFKIIENFMDRNEKFFFTRFSDGEIWTMIGKEIPSLCKTVNTPELQNEMIEAMCIKDEKYLKAVGVIWDHEPGMRPGIFLPFGNIDEKLILEIENKISFQESILNPITFHYLAVFKPKLFGNFIAKHIWNKKKMFIGCGSKENMEKLFGTIDTYIETPRESSFDALDDIWEQVKDNLNGIELVLPTCGLVSAIINKKLFEMNAMVQSLDFGSIVDCFDFVTSRLWIDKVGPKTRDRISIAIMEALKEEV